MSNKITAVAEVMASNPAGIEEFFASGNEFYFRYKGHVFSIVRRGLPDEDRGVHSLYVYPKWTKGLSALAAEFDSNDYQEPQVKIVGFHGGQLGEEQFSKLYNVLDAKDTGLDSILDDILEGGVKAH
jgi:hypothetical protein